MIGLKKQATKGKSQTKYITYDKFSTLATDEGRGTLAARDAMNCTTVDGNLSAGVGMDVYYSINDELIPITTRNPKRYFVYYSDEFEYGTIGYLTFEGDAYFINEDELIVTKFNHFGFDTKVYNCYDENLQKLLLFVGGWGWDSYTVNEYKHVEVYGTYDSCMHGDRLYVMTGDKTLKYSHPLDYFNFTPTIDDGGEIYFYSNYDFIKNMIAYKDAVYFMYEYEIVEVKTAGAARDFKTRRIDYRGGEILKEAACIFNDKLYFLAADGVYVFDGVKTKKVYEKLNIVPYRYSYVNYAVCCGKLVLLYQNMEYDDVCVVLYPDDEYGYYTTCFYGLGNYKGRTCCIYDEYLYRIEDGLTMPDGESRYFCSFAQDFGAKGRKTLKYLRFEGDFTFGIDVYVDGVRRIDKKFVEFIDGVATLPLDLRGKEFTFMFWVNTGCSIRKMTAEVECA